VCRLLLQDLGCHELKSTSERAIVLGDIGRPPEVCDLKSSIRCQQQILRLDVSMDDSNLMNVLKTETQLHCPDVDVPFLCPVSRETVHVNQQVCLAQLHAKVHVSLLFSSVEEPYHTPQTSLLYTPLHGIDFVHYQVLHAAAGEETPLHHLHCK
jgi:hypothetical protein